MEILKTTLFFLSMLHVKNLVAQHGTRPLIYKQRIPRSVCASAKSGREVIKRFSCSTQLSMKFVLLYVLQENRHFMQIVSFDISLLMRKVLSNCCLLNKSKEC